jgi:ribosomal protein L37AE/L43A
MNRTVTILGTIALFTVLQVVLSFWTNAQDAETIEIMPFVVDNTYCLDCHQAQELKDQLKDPRLACTPYCMTCHTDMGEHHVVGVGVPVENLPAVLILDKRKEMACISCHNLGVQRYDGKPWKCESLFGRFFKGASRYKTYFLAVRNNRGQLCKICH